LICRKIPEITGTWKQYSGRKSLEKSENFLPGILLPQNHRNYPETAVSGLDCPTREILSRLYNSLERDLNRLHIVYLEYAIKGLSAKVDLIEFKNENWAAL
jgi:hypothetical protein